MMMVGYAATPADGEVAFELAHFGAKVTFVEPGNNSAGIRRYERKCPVYFSNVRFLTLG